VQVDAVKGDRAAVRHADNDDVFASAGWQRSHMSFTKDGACELMQGTARKSLRAPGTGKLDEPCFGR